LPAKRTRRTIAPVNNSTIRTNSAALVIGFGLRPRLRGIRTNPPEDNLRVRRTF
jgi:hypothetical protein